MNKEKQKPALIGAEKIVPELRFSTFEKSDNWRDVKLIDVTNKNKKWSFTGGPFGSDLKSSDYVKEKDGVRIIQLQNIGDGEFKNDYKIYTSKEKADELLSSNIYPGDIIMSKMGDPVGRACLIPDFHNRYVMSSDGIRIAVDEDKFDKYFIYLVINSKIFRSKVENSSTGSTRKRIGLIDLKKLTLSVPKDKEEQQKIANCLSSLDNVITAETEKLDHLKDHKKGLLQQLFPANGATKPQFRFPEFVNDGDWEEKNLDKVFNIYAGGDKPSNISNIKTKEFYVPILSNGINDKALYGWTDKPKVKIPSLTVSARGTIGWVSIQDKPFYPIIRLIVLNPKADLNLKYAYYFMKTIENNYKVPPAGIPQLTKPMIKVVKILIPACIEEQQKIAHCLSSADDLIAAQQTKIKALKKHKKGLMQQLFPNSITN